MSDERKNFIVEKGGKRFVGVVKILPDELDKGRKIIKTEDDLIRIYSNKRNQFLFLYKEAIRLKSIGYSYRKVAKILNLPLSTVWQWFSKGLKSFKEIERLKRKNLIPLSVADKRLPILSRIIGYAFGDSHFSTRTGEFFGENQIILEDIKKDIFTVFPDANMSSINYKKNPKGVGLNFRLYDSIIVKFLIALGVSFGDKMVQKFFVPDWIQSGDKEIQRNFLAGLIDAEGSCPMYNEKIYQFVFSFSMSKIMNLHESHKLFLNQIRKFLAEFNIKTSKVKCVRVTRRNKDGKISGKFRFYILGNAENMFNFWKNIKFPYSKNKQKSLEAGARKRLSNLPVNMERAKKYDLAMKLRKEGKPIFEIAKEIQVRYKCVYGWIKYKKKSRFYSWSKKLILQQLNPEPKTYDEIASALNKGRSTIQSHYIPILEKKRLIKRVGKRKQAWLFGITEKGLKLLAIK